jgi:hypothetical protein
VNQHQILDLITVFDEGIRAIDAAGKKERYTSAWRSGIAGELEAQRYLVAGNPGGVDIADGLQVGCKAR